MITHIYGIKNCDTMKKALRFLDEHGVDYVFHDYKKEGVDEHVLQQFLEEYGWEVVVNRRGTTWRKLADEVRESMDHESAMREALNNPSLIKRPLLLAGSVSHVGFDEERYREIFDLLP